jgi:hypothetical protein
MNVWIHIEIFYFYYYSVSRDWSIDVWIHIEIFFFIIIIIQYRKSMNICSISRYSFLDSVSISRYSHTPIASNHVSQTSRPESHSQYPRAYWGTYSLKISAGLYILGQISQYILAGTSILSLVLGLNIEYCSSQIIFRFLRLRNDNGAGRWGINPTSPPALIFRKIIITEKEETQNINKQIKVFST